MGAEYRDFEIEQIGCRYLEWRSHCGLELSGYCSGVFVVVGMGSVDVGIVVRGGSTIVLMLVQV